MNLLLDTHALLFWQGEPQLLPKKVLEAISNPENQVWFSLASVWEMQLKIRKGKLRIDVPLDDFVERTQLVHRANILPIRLEHILHLETLPNPPPHRDPFDHLLLVQAQLERLVFVSKDRRSQDDPSLTILW